ncbi:MAG: 3-oxoacyl-[acyl-carrier-protein] reductase [Actinobacteria bacterium]|nr:MAG: 3-oxoacyl-[acyl-carrier-protein] reductase [Actinomycetota bacterium]
MSLEGKLAVVTGGSRGIGQAIAYKLASMGADIAINSVEESADEALNSIKSLGKKATFETIDVTNQEQVNAYFEKVVADNNGKIDILVNNAGITRDNLMLRMKEEEWDSVLAVNLKGTFNCCQAASKYMMKNRTGNIVNIASVIGIMGNAGQVNYAASKAGVIALTKSLAKELASRNIRVNAVAPGFIKTLMTEKLADAVKEKIAEQIPMKQLGEAQDVANTVAFLASDESSYITGQIIVVDGGMVM